MSLVSSDATTSLSRYQQQVLEYNQRIQRQNSAPAAFPAFIRDKFDITVVADGYSVTPEGTPFLKRTTSKHNCCGSDACSLSEHVRKSRG